MAENNSGTFDRVAAPYDRALAPLERIWLQGFRSDLLPLAEGNVLEVGIGTGASLPYYRRPLSLVGIDESVEMLEMAVHRTRRLAFSVPLSQMDVEHLGFADESFDMIVACLVLCSVYDQARALAELRRVLVKPDGRLLLIEHMRPSNPWLARLMDLANIPWHRCNGRCHLNRQTERELCGAGFRVERRRDRTGGLFRLLVARVQ